MHEAEQAYIRVIAEDPACFEAQHFLGILLAQQNRFEDALEPVSAAARLRPESPETLAVLAVALSNVGCHQEALGVQDKLLALRPGSAETHYNRGVSLAGLRRHAEAVESYRRAIALAPANTQAFHNLGNSLIELGRHQEALAAYDGIILNAAVSADILVDRGNVLFGMKRYEEALASHDRALADAPDHSGALASRGHALRGLERHGEAVACYDRVLALAPGHVEALANKGAALDALDRSEEALACLDAALAIAPDDVAIMNDRCVALHHLGRYDEALAQAQSALDLDPRNPNSHYSFGAILHAMGRYDEAAGSYRVSIELAPETGAVHKNLGGALLAGERFDEALASFDRAIELGTKVDDARSNRALVYLGLGQFERGWAEYQYRFGPERATWRPYPRPLWDGESLDGPLLVWGEQGLGDQILYASMIAEAPARAGKVVFEVEPRLTSLFARSFPGIEIVPGGAALYAGAIAAHIPCGSLGQYLRPSWDSFPRRKQGYLAADPARISDLRERLKNDDRLVVGLSWGSANKKFEKAKTAGLAAFEPLLRLAGCRFVDLQYGDTHAEREHVERTTGVRVEHLDDIDNTNDIDGLAALIGACDAVVTVSNTTAHLAGALGKETFVLVPYGQARMWYWFHDRADNPFYASVRVRRQRAAHEWADVIAPLAREIEGVATSAGASVP